MNTPGRQDSVFLLTLVDFLFQIIFFGLFAYAVSIASESSDWKAAALALQAKFKDQSAAEVAATVESLPTNASQLRAALDNQPQVDRLEKHFGVSNITELTDELTRMAPVDQLKSASKLIQKAGSVERANDAVDKYLKSGIGKPACLYATGGKGRVKPLATVIGYEDHLVFQSETPELGKVLADMNLDYDAIESLPLAQFKKVFSRLGSLYPECMYTFDLIEKTRYVEPRDAATANWNVRVIPRKG